MFKTFFKVVESKLFSRLFKRESNFEWTEKCLKVKLSSGEVINIPSFYKNYSISIHKTDFIVKQEDRDVKEIHSPHPIRESRELGDPNFLNEKIIFPSDALRECIPRFTPNEMNFGGCIILMKCEKIGRTIEFKIPGDEIISIPELIEEYQTFILDHPRKKVLAIVCDDD